MQGEQVPQVATEPFVPLEHFASKRSILLALIRLARDGVEAIEWDALAAVVAHGEAGGWHG